MDNITARYRALAEYDTLVLPTLAMIEPFRGGGLERWYIQQVTRRTFLAVTGVGFMSRSSTSAGPVYRQRLAPRPMLPPRSRPPRLLVDEFGHPVPPLPRRVSRLCILRRVRLVLLAVRAGRAAHFATALAQHEQTKRRAADPRAAHADRLKQCAQYLLGESAGLNIIAKGTIPDIAGWTDKLPTGQRYFCPWGWPIDRASKLTAEIDLFYKLLAELGPDTPAAPATIESLDTPAAFWEALRQMPMEVEWVNDSPRYTVPVYLLGYEDFNEDLRPLREAFEAALPKLKTKHLRLLHHDLSELLGIDRQSFRRLEALYNERNYALQFLPDDYPILRFEVAAPGRGLASPWQWVNPSIWTGFIVLMQYKQEVARTIYDKISAALDKLPYPFPTTAPATTEPPQPGSPALETPAAVAAYPWAEIEALALQIELRKDGRFTPAGNRIAAAVAGLIDALLDNNIISDTVTRPIHYANFSEHYGQPIGADRVKPTRTHWHQKARKELGLPDLKPPKLRV